ncbi:MAG: hypothetical protein HZC22_07170 [Rhodocyclales bacterium]|nr:hypothetical protein [Rhodocyclales bacterium]
MAQTHKIVFYPVGNGDTCQIVLASGRRILFDYCHRRVAENDDDKRIDLKKQLKDEMKAADRSDIDVVAFTHADTDHIAGFTDFFELRHAAKYQGDDRIKIKELWVPAALLIEEVERDKLSSEFAILRREARYRVLEDNGIKVFSKPKRLMDEWLRQALKDRGEVETARDHLFVDAGTLVSGFSLAADGAEFFCHSPFIKHCDEGDELRNEAALIFNVRLRADGADYDFLQIGDSTWEVLEDIVSITKFHKNEDRLKWNLLNIPHHCSYLALSDDKGEQETEPKPLVKELLLHGKKDSYQVSSSDPIPDSKDMYEANQPPHIQAKNAYETYRKKVQGRRVVVTMEEPNASKPEPLTFEVTVGGVAWIKAISGAPAVLASKPPRAGLESRPIRVG